MIWENSVIFTIEKGFVFVHLKGNSELKLSFLFFYRLGRYCFSIIESAFYLFNNSLLKQKFLISQTVQILKVCNFNSYTSKKYIDKESSQS